MDSRSCLNNQNLTMLILAVLVKRLGGEVSITQADIDDVAFNRLNETLEPNGPLVLQLAQRQISG